MKNRAKEAASLIRIVAGILLFVGTVIAIFLILFGIMSIVSDDSTMPAFLRLTGAALIGYGIIVAFTQLFLYAILNGFSVIVENSDKSGIENAILKLAAMREPQVNNENYDDNEND